MDTVIVLIIVAAAGVYLFMRLTGRLSSGKSGCGCGSSCGGAGACDVPNGDIKSGEAGAGEMETGEASDAEAAGESQKNRNE
ncbi:MAG: FeoB-associated Cys-rich membrane protein [Pseudomonadota bacterium]